MPAAHSGAAFGTDQYFKPLSKCSATGFLDLRLDDDPPPSLATADQINKIELIRLPNLGARINS